MLRTNLATRPFYNERVLHGVLGVTAAAVIAFTIFNLTQIVVLTRQQSSLGREAQAAEARAAELRAKAAEIRRTVDTREIDSISGAAREVNTIISQRLFSWTDLLNQLEVTLPDTVRIISLRPRVDRDGTVTVTMNVSGESVEDIDEFMSNLEKTSAFTEVFPIESQREEGGGVRAALQGKYVASR